MKRKNLFQFLAILTAVPLLIPVFKAPDAYADLGPAAAATSEYKPDGNSANAASTAANNSSTTQEKAPESQPPMNDPDVGLYSFDGMFGISLKEFASLSGKTEDEMKNFFTLDLKPDGTGILSVDGDNGKETETVKWVKSGDGKITLTDSTGTQMEGTIGSGAVSLVYEGMNISFKKDATKDNPPADTTRNNPTTPASANNNGNPPAPPTDNPPAEAPKSGNIASDAGLYKLNSISGYSLQLTALSMGITEEEMANMITVELKEDGTGVMTAEKESGNISWKNENGKIIIKDSANSTIEGTLVNGVMTLDLEGIETVLKKATA